jgi:hypothetical protein
MRNPWPLPCFCGPYCKKSNISNGATRLRPGPGSRHSDKTQGFQTRAIERQNFGKGSFCDSTILAKPV